MEQNHNRNVAANLPPLEELMAMDPAIVVPQLYFMVKMLLERVETLEGEVKELRAQLNKNSHNSHKPPSSDGFKKAPRSQRRQSGKHTGGQPGHPGHLLKLAEKPDAIVTHKVTSCERCGRSLLHALLKALVKGQVFDIPALQFFITEHQVEVKECSCGHVNVGTLPEGILPGTQYGQGAKALAVYLNQYQLLPLERTSEFFRDVFSQPISEGTLSKFVDDCSNGLEGFEQDAKGRICDSAVVHYDETGARCKNHRYWIHVASTGTLTYYAAHPNRGHKAMDAIGILPAYQGRAMHDGLGAYKKYPCFHALCNAHHQRELVAAKEDESVEWAGQMLDLLHDVKKAVDEAKGNGNSSLGIEAIKAIEDKYDDIVDTALKSHSPERESEAPINKGGRKKQSKSKNLLDRFRSKRSEILAFMNDFRVPYDNNQAERDLRMVKVKLKVSGTFRSERGIHAFCRIRSLISTMRKQGRDVLKSISDALMKIPIVVEFG
jgi:transposase